MSIREIIENTNLSIEEVAMICGLDAQTVVECKNNSKHKNSWAISIILEILGADYDNITV